MGLTTDKLSFRMDPKRISKKRLNELIRRLQNLESYRRSQLVVDTETALKELRNKRREYTDFSWICEHCKHKHRWSWPSYELIFWQRTIMTCEKCKKDTPLNDSPIERRT